MIQTLKNAWKVPELKKKLLFTLLIIVLYRLGANIPVPFINSEMMSIFAEQTAGSLFQYMSLLSGDAFTNGTLFALGVSPYITASIVVQLLTIAIPALERWAKDGEAGKKKLTTLTRWVTVALALVTSYGFATLLDAGYNGNSYLTASGQTFFGKVVIIACFCAGAALVMWLAEKVNEFGIGNGISIILFANIISRATALLGTVWAMTFTKTSANNVFAGFSWLGLVKSILSIAITIAIVYLIVWFTESERRIPIQYAKRQVGRKMYGGQTSNLPLKMNMAGVMPIIFASSIVSIPATIAGFIKNHDNWFYKFVENWFSAATWPYLIVYIVLIFLFSYFYIMISFNPVEVSNNIRSQGGSVPGIRPGKPTSDYITRILNRITTIGAVFLAFIAGFPMLINLCFKGSFAGLAFGGSSLLIVVGVALETFRALESQLAMRNYKGFLD